MTSLADAILAIVNGVMHLLVMLPLPATLAVIAGAVAFSALAAAELEDLARASRKPEVQRH